MVQYASPLPACRCRSQDYCLGCAGGGACKEASLPPGQYFAFRRLEDDFLMEREMLGCGMSGQVRRGTGKMDGKQYAVKTLNKKSLSPEELSSVRNEINIHLSLDHPHIVRLERVYETDTVVHLVMELLQGGDLLSRVVQRGRFSEDETAEAVRQVLSAVEYLHAKSLVHRDLKLEHMMYCQRGSTHLKLIDFGLAERWKDGTKMTRSCGTLHYTSPELLANSYTEKVDLWSVGICTYAMLCGTLPFSGTSQEVERSVRTGRLHYSPSRFHNLSPSAQDFVKGLLAPCPDERVSAAEALAHVWTCCDDMLLSSSDVNNTRLASKQPVSALARSREHTLVSPKSAPSTFQDAFVVGKGLCSQDVDRSGAICFDDLAAAREPRCCTDAGDVEKLFYCIGTRDDDEARHPTHLTCETA